MTGGMRPAVPPINEGPYLFRYGIVPRLRRMLVAASAAALAALSLHAGATAGFGDAFHSAFTSRYGVDAGQRLRDWERLLTDSVTRSEADKRALANDFFNRVPWVDDKEHYGKLDYWASPFETLGTHGADCEDFSIAKYFTLAELKVPRGRLLITYVRALKLKQAHMVLAYYPAPDADPWILDNLDGAIRRGSQRPDLVPVYSFNGDGLWMAVERGKGNRVGGARRLNAWRELLDRMQSDGWALAPAAPR